MFEVNQRYANRKGTYTVLAITPPKMTVEYEDGTTAELNIAIQARIWENIQDEEEARAASRAARERRAQMGTRFYIKSLSMETEEDLSVPGWRERITVVSDGGPKLRVGDRILFFSVEERVFFALATVTGAAQETVPKGFFYSAEEAERLSFYPIDIDEHAYDLENAVHLDMAELESVPNYRAVLNRPDRYLEITEDEFELLAELLTEISEEEDEDFDDEEEDEEEFEE